MNTPPVRSNALTPLPASYAGQRWGVFGLGDTGLSCARHLQAGGASLHCVDTREHPPRRAAVSALPGAVSCQCGNVPAGSFMGCDAVAVSPGVPLDHPALVAARAAGTLLLGDVQLFAQATARPVLAVTGSNGKSTVTTLVWKILEAAGMAVRAGGNLGTPALELLDDTTACFVLELSSFQLELTTQLGARVACILNLSADHLDRHGSLEAYAAAKSRIQQGAGTVVLNADDPLVAAMAIPGVDVRWFGRYHHSAHYHLAQVEGARWLCAGDEPVIRASALGIAGLHNELNALAAIAMTDAMVVPRAAQCLALAAFTGLPHRCRRVATHAGVEWFDDSKGTNIGATIAAVSGLFEARRGVLIAGGQGKGADFRALRDCLKDRIHTVVLIGEDAPLLADALSDLVTLREARTLREAVRLAAAAARPGEAVLLSPACASFDMFEGYAHRGQVFTDAVIEWTRA